ncbi:hypothetical protein J3Q64DRAFT_1823052 [Phycomyces blakesleeanus]|uniref:Uncharacterized protein n=2 Tax=Phycomyces blakesleeanus TaxID=4837 RepID=A0A162UW06_PHYB8|nr:hypothetical protein PHYBLDRAFT_69700 [Phycomyces blakesleeanus NRRL 1555(-)]OAD78352.1 hypothetical protein PHYBLDRAFT_69700 [Phycomyces blakesleeanus NRRL 1555(-)]|eukprot:XP_018296392.1 hypothetical protein PHYBLDRAFT_69700 [Phycomyces blakesleeanus NRRL 1555(-)]
MFFYMSKRIKSMTPSSLSPHYAAQSPSERKPDLVAKEVLKWWQTNGKHPFIQPHISSPSNVGANSPENLPLGDDKVQLIRLPVASPSAVKKFSQVSSEEPAHLTTGHFTSRGCSTVECSGNLTRKVIACDESTKN